MAALELDLDLGEGLIDPQSLLDQGVVDPDREDDQQDDDADDDDGARSMPLLRSGAPSRRWLSIPAMVSGIASVQ